MVVFRSKERGFTIVELLIVIVVIGILAAIVIVAYTGITNRANDEAVKSNLDSLVKKMATYQAINGTYPTSADDFYNMDGGIKLSKGSYNTAIDFNALVCLMAGGSGYGIIAESKTTNRYYVSYNTLTPTATTQALNNVGGASVICPAIGASASTTTFMWITAWNSKVSS